MVYTLWVNALLPLVNHKDLGHFPPPGLFALVCLVIFQDIVANSCSLCCAVLLPIYIAAYKAVKRDILMYNQYHPMKPCNNFGHKQNCAV